MMLGSVFGSAIGGIFNTKTSFRNLMTVSVICYFAGMLLLGTITPDTSRTLLTLYMILTGFGMGFSFSLLPIASIHNLEPRFRGSANSTNSFLRSFGMTLGVTIYGAIQNNVFTSKMTDAFKGMQRGPDTAGLMEDPRQLFQSDAARFRLYIDKSFMMSDSTLIFTLALIPIGLAAITVFMGKGNTIERGIITKKSAKSALLFFIG
jgi:MFS family permease